MSCPATSARLRVPIDTVHEVFQLQHTDRDQAEDLLLALIRDTFPLDVARPPAPGSGCGRSRSPCTPSTAC
jgi:hypothetical protein